MKSKLILCVLLMTSLSLQIFAQRREGGLNGSDYDPMEKPNIVKLNISSLAFKNIALQYERILGDKISIACGLRYMPKGSLPLTNSLDQLAEADSTEFSSLKTSSFAITPEFRFYPKHAGKGFYLAPYLRYRNINMDLPVDYIDDNNKPQNVTATGKFNSFIGGLMIGSQFNLGPMVTLDWFIIGLQYGVTKGDLAFTTTQAMSLSDQADIKSTFEDIKSSASAFNDISYTITPNSGTLSANLGLLGFRGFGLNIGFKF
jgi:hypothetical protein